MEEVNEEDEKLIEYNPENRIVPIPYKLIEDILQLLYDTTDVSIEVPAHANFEGTLNATIGLNGRISIFMDIQRESEAPEPQEVVFEG